MANRLDSRWDLLGMDPVRSVFQLCDATHPLDFYIGKDNNKQRLFLLVIDEPPPSIKDMRAISIQSFRRDDGKYSLLLTLKDNSLSSMFSLLCEDLVESSRNAELPVNRLFAFVLTRLSGWRRLLERGITDVLSEGEIRGLCGELLFLQMMCLEIGKPNALRSWVGPQKADQDFQIEGEAWEIKTTRAGARSITISSEFQLHSADRTLHLVVFELGDGIEGKSDFFNLNTLINKIRDDLANDHDSRQVFEDKLLSVGYVPRAEYDLPLLKENSLVAFKVEDNFPKISPDMLNEGVHEVSYEITLSACKEFCVERFLPSHEKDL